jgi:hypothetical protein
MDSPNAADSPASGLDPLVIYDGVYLPLSEAKQCLIRELAQTEHANHYSINQIDSALWRAAERTAALLTRLKKLPPGEREDAEARALEQERENAQRVREVWRQTLETTDDAMVLYDGRWMLASHASELHQEAAKRRQDSPPRQSVPHSPKPDLGAEWDHQKLSLDERFKAFWAEDDEVEAKWNAERKRLAAWGFSGPIDPAHLPEDAYTFDQVLNPTLDWCPYTNEKWLIRFLRDYGYPENLIALRVITRFGYETLTNEKLNNRRVRDTQRKRKRSPVSGNQVSEPIPRRASKKQKPPQPKI